MNEDERLYQAAKAFRYTERSGRDYKFWSSSKVLSLEDDAGIYEIFKDLKSGKRKISVTPTLREMLGVRR